ncbi:MAG: hypothetical protein IJM81_10175 [Prevotella sp.]|nr:hypothetical protein [Prevotella sp.]
MRKTLWGILFVLLLVACSSIDCPLSNTVYTSYKLAGDVSVLTKSLTVSSPVNDERDTILIYQIANVDSFILPMSYTREEDILHFTLTDDEGNEVTDEVRVTKENHPHFESLDCAPAFFHTITDVTTTNNAIEKIEINNKNVNYDASKAHFHIYFKSDSE